MALPRYRPGVDGPFGAAEVRHLFRRGGFGLPAAECESLAPQGLDAALAQLFASDEGRDAAAAGKDAGVVIEQADRLRELRGLQALWLLRMAVTRAPAHEKLALFWHGHFATSYEKVLSAGLMWRQYRLFREQGAGGFRDLLQQVARDPAMLIWLDSNSNGRIRPNENFSRELMELFSLGVGHYGEKDVQEAARAFTGWEMRNDAFFFNPREHDGGGKRVLSHDGPFDGGDVVDLCVDHPACARFIATKLLRFYVMPEPSDAVVTEVAAALVEEKFAIGKTLERLFASQLFFSKAARGALIQSPVELCVAAVVASRATVSWTALADATAEMGQALFAPPNVKGWDGQRAWINSRTLLARGRFAESIAFGGGAPNVRVDWKSVVGAAGAGEASLLIDRLASALLAVTPSNATVASLKAFAASAAAGENEARTRNVAHLVLSSPEAQLH